MTLTIRNKTSLYNSELQATYNVEKYYLYEYVNKFLNIKRKLCTYVCMHVCICVCNV